MSREKKDINRIVSLVTGINHYVLAVLILTVTVLLCIPLSYRHGYYLVAFILLFVVSVLATFMRIGPVLMVSILSSFVWNFFFIPPHYTFHIEKPEDILMFGMFFIVVFLNGIFTTRVRMQEKLAVDREERSNALFQLTKELSKASGVERVKTIAINEINRHFSLQSFIVLQDGNNAISFSSKFLKEKEFSKQETENVEALFKNTVDFNKKDILNAGAFTFYPLIGTRLNPGVLAIKTNELFPDEKKVFWDTFLTQISNALEREFNAELAQKALFLVESDKLYKTLFNSVSHELRIPVATIMGASEALLTSTNLGLQNSDLHNEIFTASLRLNRLIENLLNMSRLESGRISARLDWYDINDLVNKISENLKDELKLFSFQVDIQKDLSLIKVDFGLMEQVLYNLIYNSCEHSPVSSLIQIKFSYENKGLVIEITDRGPGFPEESLPNVFKKFFRVEGSKTGGLGLGLSIVKGFVEAHKGAITVMNRTKGGARFEIYIPMEKYELDNIQLTENE